MKRETFPVGPLQCNCSILSDELSLDAIVIDPGDDVPRIVTYLATHRLKLRQIVVTHAHIDHIAGAHTLKAATGAPIRYNQRDLPLVGMMAQQATWLGISTPTVVPPDDDLADGERLELDGLRMEVISTPGHTQGSCCLYAPDNSLLIAGDTLFAGSIGRTDLPGGNHAQLLRSIQERLLVLPDEVAVIPGHGAGTSIGRERACNPWLQSR